MRSSTSVRMRRTSPTRSSAGRRASGGMLPRSCSSIEASATSAVSGVRSSWATSATNSRFCCCEVSRRAIVASSESAIRLNSMAHRPTSSRPRCGTRAERSPAAMRRAARPASATGRRSQRAMTQATSSAMPIATAPPASSPARSWARAASTGSAGNTKNRSGGPPWRPPTTRTGSPARSCHAKPSSPPLTMVRSPGDTAASDPVSAGGSYGEPSPKSASTRPEPRSAKAVGSPLASNVRASVGRGSAPGSSTDRL